jgi:hypothetical protein
MTRHPPSVIRLRDRGSTTAKLARSAVSPSLGTPGDPRVHASHRPLGLERLCNPASERAALASGLNPDPPRAPPMYPHAARLGGGSVEPVSGGANSSVIRLCAMFPPKIRLFDVSADTRPQSAPDTGSFRSSPGPSLPGRRLESTPVSPCILIGKRGKMCPASCHIKERRVPKPPGYL